MMHAAIYGRLGQDPQQRPTKTDTTMATASMAVDLTGHSAVETTTQWFGIVAFGRVAEALLRCKKGDLISASGRVTLNVWSDRKTGESRSQLQVAADSVFSARTVRPGGARKKATRTTETAAIYAASDRMQQPSNPPEQNR